MMSHQLRDILADRAEQAIHAVLARTAPQVSAQALLDYIRRSGLLLERQSGSYGFAHLTLQEYQAAAVAADHRSRRQVLIEHVGDPWWRETILLWAARNDATPIVEACLATRTTAALGLAYACAEEARELDQALRDQLTQLLSTTPTDPAEARLLDSVTAARTLHDSLRLEDGTTLCVRPISRDLWNRYTQRTSTSHAPARQPGPGPAMGLWASDVNDFITWLNNLFDDGTSYRLPTSAEITHPEFQAVIATINGTIWTQNTPRQLQLHQPDGIPHPHRPTASQLADYAHLIMRHTYLLLRLATSADLSIRRLLIYGYLANNSLPSPPVLQSIRVFDLTTAVHTARTLARALDPDPDLNLVLALALALDLALDLLDLARDLAFARLLMSPHHQRMDAVIQAGVGLLKGWPAKRSRTKARSGLSLKTFLAEALSACAQAPPADDLPAALQKILNLAKGTQPADPPLINLLTRAADLTIEARNGDTPSAERDLVLAAALLLVALLRRSSAPSWHSAQSEEDWISLLQGALTTLVALTTRTLKTRPSSSSGPNQIARSNLTSRE